MSIINFSEPAVGCSYRVKGGSQNYFRVIAKRKNKAGDVFTAQSGRFIWEGSKADFHNDFITDAASVSIV